ncbi:MAG TPA: PDZ domain-containing protein [Clostridiaceae bacterium]|nr:PDZ domain-containing protein [Clostridiaceae bacterium]
MDILAMINLCIRTVSAAVLSPGANFIYVVFIIIIFTQYKKVVRLQEYIYNKPKTPTSNLVLTSILSGLVAGIVISIPMTLMGITFSQDMGIQYLILISLILMFIEPRFICFSYSGGILSIAGLLFNIKGIDVTGIMILVGMLHLLEAVLIYIDGYRGAVPVFLQREDGKVVGGFTMQRFWPIPIALVMFVGFSSAKSGASISTPDWWPVIKPFMDPSNIKNALFQAFPVSAILGYSEFTSSCLPREKCRKSAIRLMIFSVMLLSIAISSSYVYALKYVAALFAPFAHEYLIEHERKSERNKGSIFSAPPLGIRVLDTIPGGPAEMMGIKSGDTILSINNRTIVTEEGMNCFFNDFVTFIWVDVKGIDGRIRTLEYKDYKNGIDGLGILTVPKSTDGLVTIREQKSFVKRIYDRLKNKPDV